MKPTPRHLRIAMVAATGLALTACGVTGNIADFGTTPVYEEPNATNSPVVAELSTMNEVTVECHLSAEGYYQVSFDGGEGYISDSTEIMSDEGDALRPDSVPDC